MKRERGLTNLSGDHHLGPTIGRALPGSHDEAAAWGRMPVLPEGLEEYKRTATFDPDTTPAGLRRTHDLKAGTWGEIVIVEGQLLYVLEDDGDLILTLTPDRPGVVAPTRPHHIVPQPGSRFFVRFLRAPAG